MLSPLAPGVILGPVLAQAGSMASAVAVLGLGAAGVLGWLYWRARQDFTLELTEQSHQVAEEQEKGRQILQDRETLIKESQGKSEMLATLSREIRAHLNGVIGSADLLMENSLKPHQRDLVTTLRSSAEALHQSLNDVLEFSSIETGRIQLAQAPFDLRQPLIDVVESLSPQALLKGLDLVLIVAPDVPLQVTGDVARLRQVLQNLASNAVRFTSQGRVVLRVELPKGSASPSATRGNWLHFSVSDTGPSIPEPMLATLFERFGQDDSPSPRKFGGSGLELAISQKLVELMGGRIGARNLPDTGTEFWTVLPLAIATRPTTPAPRLPDRLHVVVLDNVAASRVATSAMLTRMGVDHDVTETAANAVTLLRDAQESGAHDLVLLLDESVAAAGGAELGRMTAAGSPLQSAHIILLSRQADAHVETYPFPVAGVVRKPLVRTETLVDALRHAPSAMVSSRAPFESAGDAKPRPGPHVLVVDDDEISRSVSSQLISRLGCVVQVVSSGREAVEVTRRTQFDLIFMDCQMPEMDGFATTEKIRATTGSRTPPIVALTANISVQDRERCFAVGMCDFIGKPARKAELDRIIKTWIPPEKMAAK
jgi:two-component system sensor histidine kinase/response regulator